jgi:hypothetical protein
MKGGVARIGAAGMAEYLGHERLKVYQKGMPFASMRKTLLDDLPGELRHAQATLKGGPG